MLGGQGLREELKSCGQSVMNRIYALQKGPQRGPLARLPYGLQQKAIHEPGSGPPFDLCHWVRCSVNISVIKLADSVQVLYILVDFLSHLNLRDKG